MRSATAALLVALFALPAAAQGIVMETSHRRPIRPHRTQPIRLRSHRVDIVIDEQVATTKVEQVFHNPNHQPMV